MPAAIRAALYKRVSSQVQAREGYSLDFQEEVMRSYCTLHDLEVVAVYEDGGRSGANTRREGLQRLVSDAKQHDFRVVLIFRVDRFSREPLDLLFLVQQLGLQGIALKSVTEAVDASDPAGELMLTVLGAIAKFVRSNIIQNAMLGKRKRAERGRYTGGGVPFGYTVGEGGRYDPDIHPWSDGRTAAETIPYIFDSFLRLKDGEGHGLRLLARRLNDDCVPAPRGGQAQWSSVTLRQILRNPVYTGDFVYAKTKQPMHGNVHARPREEWIVAPGSHEILVPRAVWDRVQAVLDENRRGGGPRAGGPSELLSGFLRCSLCASSLTPRRASGSAYLYYTCGSRFNERRVRDGQVCAFPYIRAQDLEQLVWRLVTAIASDEATVERVLSGGDGQGQQQLASLERRIAAQRKELERCDRDEARLLDMALQDLFQPDLLKSKVDQVHDRRAAVERALLRLEHEWQDAIRQRPYLVADPAQVRTYVRTLVAGDEVSLSDRRAILAALVGYKGIGVSPDGTVEVNLRLPASVLRAKLDDDEVVKPLAVTRPSWPP